MNADMELDADEPSPTDRIADVSQALWDQFYKFVRSAGEKELVLSDGKACESAFEAFFSAQENRGRAERLFSCRAGSHGEG